MWRWLPIAFVPAIILCFPPPEGLTPVAWNTFAIYCGAILGLILRPMSEGVILCAAIAVGSVMGPFGKLLGLKNIVGIPLNSLLAGYASSTVWLVFSAFLISRAFQDTGLGKRTAYILVGKFGKTPLGLAFSAALTDTMISPATPSNTARTGGIVFPIYRSVASALGSEPGPTSPRIGAYLAITLFHICNITGCFFITACAPNALSCSLAKDILGVDITWALWAQMALVPGLVVLGVVPFVLYKLCPPELKHISNNKEISQEGLAAMGPMSREEKLLIVLFILAIVGWATGHLTNISSAAVAISFFVLCLLLKLISWDNVLKTHSAWATLIWFGGVMGFAETLTKQKFFVWLGDVFGRNFSFAGYNSITILGILVLLSLVIRYACGATSGFVAAFFPLLFSIGKIANVPPYPLAMLMATSAVYGTMLTTYSGAAGPVFFGPGYVDVGTWYKAGAIVALLCAASYMAIGLPYWKMLGLW